MVPTQRSKLSQEINKIKRDNSATCKATDGNFPCQIVPDCSGRPPLGFCGAIPSKGDNDSALASL